jgi:periplasmic protein TonB
MAPILKELEAPAGTPSASAPAAPQPRPQPIALEIPVTVNGARTVDGSDKRVPFSENTQTVLVLPHGAVIRTTTPLASGQLVFLTNEKTKKEVVCQVVKSKSSGSAGSYVELQFTEPSPGFWGLQIPGASAIPPGPRPVAPAAPAAPKVAPPAAPVAVNPPIVPQVAHPPVALPSPVAVSAPPATPIVVPPPPAVVPHPPVAVQPEPVVAPPPAPMAIVPEAVPEIPVRPVAPANLAPQVPAASETSVTPAETSSQPPLPPVPPLRDYTKEIEALFSVPRAPVAPAAQPQIAATANHPTTEDLKQQASRLQAQLSSMLFTEVPGKAQVDPVSKSAEPEAPAAELPKQVLEIAAQELKPAKPIESNPIVSSESKAVVSAHKAALVSLSAEEEEVKIPSWLAPISQNSGTVATSDSDSSAASSAHAASVNSEESYNTLAADSGRRPQTAVFGGQLLGEAAASADGAAGGGSKKGLILGLIAAAVVLAGGWYYMQNQSGSVSTPRAQSFNVNSRPETISAPDPAPSVSASVTNKGGSSATPTQPARSSTPAPSPATAALQPQNSKPAQKSLDPPAVEEAAKPSLGEVHLAAPVVNRSESAPLETDGLQNVATNSTPAGADPFASAHHNAPAAPLPVGGDVKPAELIKSVPPEYPSIAKGQHVSGKVTLDALVDVSGNVASLKVVSGPSLLHRAALDAVKQWKYKPAVLDGEPTASHLSVTVEFRAQ